MVRAPQLGGRDPRLKTHLLPRLLNPAVDFVSPPPPVFRCFARAESTRRNARYVPCTFRYPALFHHMHTHRISSQTEAFLSNVQVLRKSQGVSKEECDALLQVANERSR